VLILSRNSLSRDSRDHTARYGHAAAVVFNLALIPTMVWPYWVGNVVLIGLHALCLATRFQVTPRPGTVVQPGARVDPPVTPPPD
jgi:predicted tellurium resistance membrane protein TerC